MWTVGKLRWKQEKSFFILFFIFFTFYVYFLFFTVFGIIGLFDFYDVSWDLNGVLLGNNGKLGNTLGMSQIYVEYLKTALPSLIKRKLIAMAKTRRSAVALDGSWGSLLS